ncbi:Catechol 2,3-dioxygenase [Paracoccus halophilus]|uniref:Catechol 2,3-dioxygenase n=1 Tax=Paracoccus halophilus TaxID=376733 RepID=A0A099F6J3_9RHOB|nr:VOC family protein [Paracoccus halophilus]KGJ05871.1 glyoxalase [Paracoccus halophilus]SFA61610.1 Catechol 2,3-dioxygenase [Paracoccus halophilus]
MFDHIGINVADLDRSRGFYEAALEPLGIVTCAEVSAHMTGGRGAFIGMGNDRNPRFWFGTGQPGGPVCHVAFAAPDRATVDAFYRAALAAGGRDNGAPGLRPEYHPGYYGAFVLDPDGNNIEAVHHGEPA